METIKSFEYNKGNWEFRLKDGSDISLSKLPLQCDFIGVHVWMPTIDGISYLFCHWDFDKYRLCPICINGFWGFIDNSFNIEIECKFDNVGVEIGIAHSQNCHEYFWDSYLLNEGEVAPYYNNKNKIRRGYCPVVYKGKEYQIDMNGKIYEYAKSDNLTYNDAILYIPYLTISDIISNAVSQLPSRYKEQAWKYCDYEGRNLEHGTAVLETEELCSAYMVAYGRMHWQKLNYALDKAQHRGNFPYGEVKNGVEVFDWGCGQGIGALAFIENLRKERLISCLKKITLEEPSDIARARAVLHIKQAIGSDHNVKIKEYSEFLPSDYSAENTIKSIAVEQPCAIHIFSNILDLETVSLKGVSRLITSSGKKHIVLCIGPANLNESRINAFCNYFKENHVHVFTDFRDTNFGHHPNKRSYGCLIKSFSYDLSQNNDVLYEYKYFAPVQYFAEYSEDLISSSLMQGVFEVLAPFDMTAHKNLSPVYALMSNLISRGLPTLASRKVLAYISNQTKSQKIKSLNAVARIQKTFVEALISERLDTSKQTWKILVLEDDTNIAKVALDDFYETYHNLIAITNDYDSMILPQIQVDTNHTASTDIEYDAVFDVSIDKLCDAENAAFSKYRAQNGCYFIVRSSKNIYGKRILYTTERIKYKPFVEKNSHGVYENIESNCSKLRYFLNLIFRKEDFRPGQLPILNRALQLKSVIGLLPTGGGKSLTYQLAAMLQPAVTLVVDPLKGLMKDQYDGLKKVGIDCISYINSDITKDFAEGRKREAALTGSQVQIMFLSPERLSIHRFREVLRSMRESNVYFAYGVIDEVHCVSEWGHDFRLAYLHLGRNLFNYVFPKKIEGEDCHISLFGLTATASFDVLADVERELSGSNAYSLEDDAIVRYENTNRLELQYNVYEVDAENVQRSGDVDSLKEESLKEVIDDATQKIVEIQDDNAIEKIKERFVSRENLTDSNVITSIRNTDLSVDVESNWYNQPSTDAAGIVFCLRANKEQRSTVSNSVPTVEKTLRDKGFRSLSTYKGGDDTKCQDDFLNGKTSIMVATKAFGMGIDKSNVRMTFHLNYPGSLESFVQEAGRAGRDKKMALATIMYSPKKYWVKNVKTNGWNNFSADYINNKFFYDSNFLGEDFELFVMDLLMNKLQVEISNEEFVGIDAPKIADSKGIVKFINRYDKGKVLTYYVSYKESEQVLDEYNKYLSVRNMPVFSTSNARNLKNSRGFSYIRNYGSAIYKDVIQKAIYRMCIIGLIDDFTEDYSKHKFRITTICQDESAYYENLRLYYRKYYSVERTDKMIEEVKNLAKSEGAIMACLKHLTSFIYRSIADKRARGILDMEQFCNRAISLKQDWKDTNEELKDFIYYYFNSKYAREGFVTYDSKLNQDVHFSLKDDTDVNSEDDITRFDLVRKYMRVVDAEIVNNDSQMDNIKHLQGAVRLIRRAVSEMNPVLNLLNVFCILYLGQEDNEMLEEELYNDYKAVFKQYMSEGKFSQIEEFTKLLVERNALKDKEYMGKIQLAIQLEDHANEINKIVNKYIAK